MIDGTKFRSLVSGERRGIAATAWRTLFSVAKLPYGLAVACRNRQFDRGSRQVHRVRVPVISVGNLTVGGTGKTPMVEWLAKWFRGRGVRVVVISRGYRAEAGSRNDEALELEQKLPDVPHLQNPDRIVAAETAIEEFDSQLILLDDAFQHRRIHRDLNLVLLDALEPFGYGHLLPRGLLREPMAGLRRADVVALTRADAVSLETRQEIHSRVGDLAGDVDWIEVAHQPVTLRNHAGHEQALQDQASDKSPSQRIAAFCGIGNPAGFRHSLTVCGFEIVGFREFPDHHAFGADDLESLAAWIQKLDVAAAICTHKDLVKIGSNSIGSCPLWALQIGMEVLQGREQLETHLNAVLAVIDRS